MSSQYSGSISVSSAVSHASSDDIGAGRSDKDLLELVSWGPRFLPLRHIW